MSIRICGERYCSMKCVESSTGHKRIVFKQTRIPNIGRSFDAYYDPTMGKHITSWRQQERELKRFNADPNNKEKRSFFQDNHKAVLEARNFRRHKLDIAREAYSKEGIKLKLNGGNGEKGRTIYSFSR